MSNARPTPPGSPEECSRFAGARSAARGSLLVSAAGAPPGSPTSCAARTRGLFGEIAEDALPSYLSGILIGHEIAAHAPSDEVIHLIGAATLVGLYREALTLSGRGSRVLDGDCAADGLFLLASHLP